MADPAQGQIPQGWHATGLDSVIPWGGLSPSSEGDCGRFAVRIAVGCGQFAVTETIEQPRTTAKTAPANPITYGHFRPCSLTFADLRKIGEAGSDRLC
jgi:hypothetical protein